MLVRVCVILLAVLATGTSAAKLQKPAGGKQECVDNTLYAEQVCKNQKDGYKVVVPGSCSQYYECSKGVSQKKSCTKFFDPELKKCVKKSICVEVDKMDCVVPTPSLTTESSCTCITPTPPSSCPVVTCISPTCPPPKKCPKPVKCQKPPKC